MKAESAGVYQKNPHVLRNPRFRASEWRPADHSIETGLLVAKNLLGEDHDVEAVNIGAEYHEANVVGS